MPTLPDVCLLIQHSPIIIFNNSSWQYKFIQDFLKSRFYPFYTVLVCTHVALKLSYTIAFCERKPTFPGNWLAKGSCLNFYCESPKFLSKVGLQIKINVKTSHPQHTHIFKLEGNHYQGRELFVFFFLFGFTYCCITSTFHRADIQQLFVNRMDQILLLTVLLNESLNIFLYVCPPHIDTLGMFSFIIESLCRHMVNENGRKRYMINIPPIQGSKPPALQHLLLQFVYPFRNTFCL